MKLPEIIRQIGTEQSDRRVYIEDYVYAYLQKLRANQEILPLRVALYGRACVKEQKKYYFIYGAAGVIEELEQGRDEEQVRQKFFPEHTLIGYVNIYGKRAELPDKRDGYFIFYENNEEMKEYLVSCYERNRRQIEEEGILELPQAVLPRGKRKMFPVWEVLKNFLYGCLVILLTIAVTTINDYQKIAGFTKAVSKAVSLVQTIG